MQKSILIVSLLIATMYLTACNLGADAVEGSAQTSLILSTEVTLQATQEDPFENPTYTPIPTQQIVIATNNDNSTNLCTFRNDWEPYIIISGDTLSSIAVRSNTTINALVIGNCLSNANFISPGQVLYIPNPLVAPPNIDVNTSENLQLMITNAELVSTNSYIVDVGQNIIVRWENPPNFTQSVEFFANCDDLPNSSLMECTDKATDWNGTDGFEGSLVISNRFDGATITAIAFGDASQQGQSAMSEPITIIIQRNVEE